MKTLKHGLTENRIILLLFQKKLFSEITEVERQTFQGKRNHLIDTQHRYTHHTTPHHTHNLDFSADYYGAHPPLFMFEFDSQQVYYVCCYVMSY